MSRRLRRRPQPDAAAVAGLLERGATVVPIARRAPP